MITADEAARGAIALAEAGVGVGYVPRTWAPIMLTIQHVPSVIFRRTNI
jgi:DNA-binding transcriptional LysR family regulator